VQVHFMLEDNILLIEPTSAFETGILEQCLHEHQLILKEIRDDEGDLSFLGIEFSKIKNGVELNEEETLVASPISEKEIEEMYDESIKEDKDEV